LGRGGGEGLKDNMDLSHRPNILYQACLDRAHSASVLLDSVRDYPMAMYTAGLAVECIIQAIALNHGATHNARHNLANWLTKCPEALDDTLRGTGEWNLVVALWRNELRYLSFEGLLHHLRERNHVRGLKGSVESLVRTSATRFVSAAGVVQKKGVAEWLRSCTKKR